MISTQPVTALRWGVVTVATVIFLLLLGRFAATDQMLTVLGAGAVLGVGMIAAEPAAVPVVAMPLLVVSTRVAAGGTDLTISDAALAVALLPAIMVALRGVTSEMRAVLWLGAIYQAASLFTVIQNPYTANAVEWVHAGVLVMGAMLVGWAVGRSGFARWGISLLFGMGLVLALSAIVQGAFQIAGGDFSPVYLNSPIPVHKNALGTIMAVLAAIAYVHPSWMGWRRRGALLAFWIFVVALAASQARQAIIGLGVALLIAVLRRTTERRRSKSILLAVIPLLTVVSVLVQDQYKSGNEFNSLFQRVTWFQDALAVWLTEPWVGVGLRWWYTDRFPARFQPPNALLDTATATGVVGLAAFIALLVGTWLVARRIDPAFGFVAELVLIIRFVQSQFDLYWVSVQTSLPFVILGVCLGALAHREAEQQVRKETVDKVVGAQHPLGTAT